jgi:calpain
MAITYNSELLNWVIPIDNAFEENMSVGAYHFRFWNFGKWCDVVVDDYLPSTKSNHLIFCFNDINRHLFWPSLAEKAFAK